MATRAQPVSRGYLGNASAARSAHVAELVDRVAAGGPVDLWGFSLGALTATGVAVRHRSKVRRLVLAAVNIRPDGYHSGDHGTGAG